MSAWSWWMVCSRGSLSLLLLLSGPLSGSQCTGLELAAQCTEKAKEGGEVLFQGGGVC